MRQQRSIPSNGLTVVAFDINDAMRLLREDYAGVEKALAEEKVVMIWLIPPLCKQPWQPLVLSIM